MALSPSPVPASQASDGNRKIIWLPSSATTPLSVATLKGATAKDLTYSFTPDGWNFSGSQDNVDDKRLTLPQNLQRPGKFTETGSVKYVASSDASSAATILAAVAGSVNGPAGFFVVRKGVVNSTDVTVGDLVDVYTVQMGVPLPDAPAENGVDTITQGVYITAPTQRSQALVS
jgi:hypothetical protein